MSFWSFLSSHFLKCNSPKLKIKTWRDKVGWGESRWTKTRFLFLIEVVEKSEHVHMLTSPIALTIKNQTEVQPHSGLLTSTGLFPILSFSFAPFPASHFSALMSASLHSGQIGNFPFFCSDGCTLLPKGYWLGTDRGGGLNSNLWG